MENNIKSVVMLNTDENGNIIGKSNLDINPLGIDYSKLEDGLYVLYRGTDWVFGNDGSLVNTAVIYDGQSQEFSQTFTKSTSIKNSSSTSLNIDTNYIKFAITQAYDVTITDTVTKTVKINQVSKPGKDTFYKIYLTYLRYDVVRVKKGKATHASSVYEFMGGRAVITEVEKGQIGSIDTEKLVIKEDTCLLQEVNNSIWQIIDSTPNTGFLTTGREGGKIFKLNSNMNFNTFQYSSPTCKQLNFIFNIEQAGDYVFLVGKAANLGLYSLNIESRDQMTKIETKQCDNLNDTYIKRFLEGGNYVLTVSADNDSNNNYSVLIQKQ